MIHPLWNPPAADAPELLRLSHQLMFRTLNDLRKRLPDILLHPELHTGEQVMEAAIGRLANPKLDPALKAGALTRLEQLMRSLDPATPRRLYLTPADHVSPIKMTVGDDLAALIALDAALDRSIIETRPGEILRSRQPIAPDPDSALTAVGRLIVMLVVRLGQCDPVVLAALLAQLVAGQKISMLRRWAWTDVHVSGDRHRQLRRVFFDPATLAGWLIASAHSSAIPIPPTELKAGQERQFRLRYLQQAFRTWQDSISLELPGQRIKKLEHLCDVVRQRLHLVSIPLVATYARGELVSSSLERSTWIRLIGGDAASSDPDSEDGGNEKRAEETHEDELGLQGLDTEARPSFAEQLTAGELDDRGLIQELRSAMDQPRHFWGPAFDQILARLQLATETAETAIFVVQWLRSLAERRNKGKLLADGSVRHYRGLIVNRLLVLLPPSLSSIQPSELEEAYAAVLDSRTSSGQAGRIASALASFDRFIRSNAAFEVPHVDIPGFEDSRYDISARIINESEYRQAINLVRDGDFVLPSDSASHRLIAFAGLAFRCGLRRTEILGLRCGDLREATLLIEEHEHRTLKTRNARRVIPLSQIDSDVRQALNKLAGGRPSDAFVFFDAPPTRKEYESAPVIGHSKSLLKRVTGDASIHAHNLRHSTASLTVLGIFGDEARIKQHPWAEPWMRDAQAAATSINAALSGRLYRYGGRANATAMMLGHGSERTTFEHYVHVMDVLLFLTCWSGYFDQPSNNPDRFLYPRRRETAQLLALLGYAPTTLIETNDAEALMRRFTKLARHAFAPIKSATCFSTSVDRSPDTATRTSERAIPRLRDLLAETKGHERGRPTKQAELDTASGLLKKLRTAHQRSPQQLSRILEFWLGQRIVNDDWASMTPSNAKTWYQQCSSLMPDISIDARIVRKDSARRTIKGAIFELTAEKQISTAGRCWVRFADTRAKVNRRTSKTGSERSRSQPVITWAIQALAARLRTEESVPPSAT
ncbi:MAG: tyrosine-type recombinase/integrase [Nevskia sp.]|nr:tyrosine-type recombinase/integrase [Nevskia sp.]